MSTAPRKTFAIVASATAAVLLGGGVAVAYWTTTGTGAGAATAGTSAPVTITQTNTITGLYPGGPARDIDINVDNTGIGPQRLTTLAVTISSITKGTPAVPAVGCVAGTDIVTTSTFTPSTFGVGITPFAKAGTVQMVETFANQDACKDVTVNLAFTAS